MSELKQIKFLLDTLQLYLQQNETSLIKDIRFDYFHVEAEKDNYIGLSKVIPMQDQRFSMEVSNYGGRSFCTTSTFWRGCIKIIKV